MFYDLLALVRTKTEADLLCREIEYLEESLYMTGTNGWDGVLKTRVRSGVAEIMSNQLPQDNEAKKDMLREIKNKILDLPVVNLTLAKELTMSELEEISDSLRTEVNAEIILDIHCDSLIVGGALVSFQGKFGDYSVATKINKAWEENGEVFIKKAYGIS